MKKILLILCFGVFFSGNSFSQEEEKGDLEKKEIVKTKDFKLFGSEWHYEKYADKSYTLITNDGDIDISGRKKRRYQRSLNFDLGINTWINDETAPTVKPWGSWNVAINYQHQYKFGKNFSLNPSIGVSWYNFKFEDTNLIAVKETDGIEFQDFNGGVGTKSKISASYLNLSLIPIVHSSNGKFRFGIGPYAGLRLGGRGKFVYDDQNGRSRKLFEKSNMYANNFRYGGRVVLGVSNVDLFVNYDLNEFFEKDKGPRVNALSFGLIL
ncbi:hypothetical protein MM213_13180 [Belliella sp. R4-6]|uniref:Outer membrane protein beta-barrel domain-containing protein n=1 Tax=Belliella alkalica TaxID=1730871 RepID=A0ABS9VES6_9BACT|nr:hypothetical protein [Belliella alkalica]MCH7414445.1 hypothetical protein [Belliella alkalica]